MSSESMTTERDPRIFILAGCHEQARTLARWLKVGPRDYVYVTDDRQLRGCPAGQTMLTFGTWYDSADSLRLVESARERRFNVLHVYDR